MKNRKFHFALRKLTVPCAGSRGRSPHQEQSPHPMVCVCGGTGRVRLTVGRLAEAIFVNRAHLNDVLNNKPGRGGNTRWKVAKYLRQQFPDRAAELLAALGWEIQTTDEHG